MAVGGVLFAVPGLGAPALAPPPTTVPGASAEVSNAEEEQDFPVDHEAIIERLLITLNAPQEKEDVADSPDDQDGGSDEPSPRDLVLQQRGTQIRYVGSMTQSSGKAWAFVVIDGVQRWSRPGEQIGDKTLVGVHSDHILLEDRDGEQTKIPLHHRVGRSVTPASQSNRNRAAPGSVRDRATEQNRGRTLQEAELERRRDRNPRANQRNN